MVNNREKMIFIWESSMFIALYNFHYSRSTVETFLRNFLEILKRPLQNY